MIDPNSFADPPGYVRLNDVCSALYHNAHSKTPWGVRRGPNPIELYNPPKKMDVTGLTVNFLYPHHSFQQQIYDLLQAGLVSGKLWSVGLLVDAFHQARFIELTAAHWRFAQRSAYAPLDEPKLPFEWAMSVGMIRLLPELDESPVVLPLLAEFDLAVFLDAETPPPLMEANVVPFAEWQMQLRDALRSDRKPSRRKGGRPPDPVQNKAMWHEVVRRAMAGELKGKTLAQVTQTIHQWLCAKFLDEPLDVSAVRRQLEGLFPTSADPAGRKGQGSK